MRPLPRLTELNRPFWTGGAHGTLLIQNCGACRYWVHPPSVICPCCGQDAPEPIPVSGSATVVSVTVNHQQWMPNVVPPYAIVLVELDEQQGLRLTTNILELPADEVKIGLRVQVAFEANGEIFVPLFRPTGDQA